MAKGIFWYIREIFCCHTNGEGGISARGYGMNEIRWGVSLMPEEANACGERGNALRGRLQLPANVWGKGCKRLRQRLQTFEAKVANVWGKGCNALRLRRAKLALKSSVLFWIREKGGEIHPWRVTVAPLWCIWWFLIPLRPRRNPPKNNPQILERFQNRDIPNVWMPSVCCASVQRLRISSSYHSGDVSVPQGVNWNDLDQLLCSHP